MSGTRHPLARAAAAIAAAVVSLGTLTACGGLPGGGNVGGTADDSWTVMTYMIADTNLEYFQMADMREQEAVGSRPGFNLVAMVDRADGYSDEAVLGMDDFVGGKYIEVKVQGNSEVREDLGDTNTGDPEVLADFLAWAIKEYPAANYALILNDHGSSWPGVGGDEGSDHDRLTLDEMQQGISAGLEAGGLDKLDLVGFDACLMATYETAVTLAPLADRMLSSEELEPGYGWDYTTLETAARGGTVDEVASAIIKGFDEQSLAEGEAQVTLSNIDLTKMGQVEEAVDAFAAAMTEDIDDLQSTIGRSLAQSLGFGATPDYNFYMTDLGMLADGIGTPEAEAVSAALEEVVVDKMDGQATRGATGMAIYFPPQASRYREQYNEIGAAQNWIGFLNSYYEAGATGGATPTLASSNAESGFTNGGFVVAQLVTSDVNQITDTFVLYGYVEGGETILIGDEAGYIDDDNYAVGFFDTYQLWIGDGSNETSFYSSFSVNRESDVATIGVPILYYPSSGDGVQGFLQMTYQPSTGTILSETFYGADASGNFAEIAPDAGATFEALKVRATSSGYQYFRSAEGVEIAADTDALQFGYRKLDSGTTVFAQINVQNAAGEQAGASATGVIP